MTTKLYVAYGSNLNMSQMQIRCPAARPMGPVVIDGWRLVFRGVADIVPAEGHQVMGGLWEITEDCEAALDRYEGYPNLYGKHHFSMEDGNEVMTYVMISGGIRLPVDPYFHTIEQGYEDFGLDTDTLWAAWRSACRNADGGGHTPVRYRA